MDTTRRQLTKQEMNVVLNRLVALRDKDGSLLIGLADRETVEKTLSQVLLVSWCQRDPSRTTVCVNQRQLSGDNCASLSESTCPNEEIKSKSF